MNEHMLADWFAWKKVDDTIIFYTIFISVPFQVRSITSQKNPLQSGSVFYEHACRYPSTQLSKYE